MLSLSILLRAIGILFIIHFLHADEKNKPSTAKREFTFVNVSGHCMFYARNITLTVVNDTNKYNKQGATETYTIPLKSKIEAPKIATCGNHSGQIVLKLNGGSGGPHKKTLDSFTLRLKINSSEALSWWSVVEAEVDAVGDVMPGGKLNGTFNASQLQQFIEGPKSFAYACGQQKPLIFHGKPESMLIDGKMQDIVKVKYALNMQNLQVQPFLDSRSYAKGWYGFTNDVYDCVPFMSIGVWMFLLCATLMLCIVLSGISMLASLKTNDRYDDIKGKPLVVNVKD